MDYIGIDIGSTAAKVFVVGDKTFYFTLPTGWSSKETSKQIESHLKEKEIDVLSPQTRIVATGYGRISVDYADYNITEITCHARGARELLSTVEDIGIIDVGGQDTKVIVVEKGLVKDFLMNDKCSAGTGKFIEVMANRLGVDLEELFGLAERGEAIPISSLCTVFAESEVINYIGQGRSREDIACGVIDSVALKVSQLANKLKLPDSLILTGGLSTMPYFKKVLSEKIGQEVISKENGKYAGAIGAAMLAKEKKKR